MKIKFRIADVNDLEEITHIVDLAIKKMGQQNILQWDSVYPTEEDFKQDIERKQMAVGVAQDKIAVFYVLNQEFDEAYKNGNWNDPDASYCVLHRLCVNPEYQNMGVARMTMDHIEEEVTSMNISSIRLDVFTKNPYALKLYKNLGYREVGYADWRKGRFYLMEKHL